MLHKGEGWREQRECLCKVGDQSLADDKCFLNTVSLAMTGLMGGGGGGGEKVCVIADCLL